MKLDHVVWFSERTPQQIVSQYKGAVVGGRHKQWGTYNALKYTRNAYLEWLTIEHKEVAEASTHPLIRQMRHDLAAYGERWGTLCFSTEDIDALNLRLQQLGWTTTGVLDASRVTSSGTLKKWKMLFIEESYGENLPAPFFIQWEEDEETRRNALRKEGALSKDNESEQIVRCVLVAEDAEQALNDWCAMLDITAKDDEQFVIGGIEFSFLEESSERNRLLMVEIDQTTNEPNRLEEGV